MSFLFKLFGGGEGDDIYNSIPWKEINSMSSDDPRINEIYKKLVLLSTQYKSDLSSEKGPLILFYKKMLSKKI